MKQLFIIMIPSMLVGTVGCFQTHPYLGVLVYYLYAVLRPQFIWQWTLPNVAWSFYVAIAAIVATIAWRIGVMSFEGEENKIETNIGHYSMYGFAIWICVTYFTAFSQEFAYPFFMEYLKIFAMFIVARYALSLLKHVWIIYLTMTITLCYISYEINEIYLSLGYMYIYRRGYGGLDNNGAALLLAMGVPLCLYAWDGLKHWVRWGFIILIPVIIHAVLTSFSRGAMLSLLVVTPIYLLRCRRRGQLLIMLVAIFATIPFLAGIEIRERFFSIQDNEIDASANARRNSWSIAWQMVKEKPVFGFGIRNSNLFTYSYGADMEGRTIHSQWLQIAADSGFPAITLYLIAIGAMFYCCHRVRRAVRHRDDLQARQATTIANGCEAAVLVFCVGATFLSLENFEFPFILFLLAAQLWALCQATNSFEDKSQKSHDNADSQLDPGKEVLNG